jgi:hypothetical protein
LRPAAGHGVRHVSSLEIHSVETKFLPTPSSVALHPSEPFPRPQPYRVATACYLLAGSDGLGHPVRRASTPLQTLGPTSRPQGLPPQPDPLHTSRRFRRVAARCSLGLRSLRGSR